MPDTSAPIILVPGFWLGAWAWDEVADILRADGHEVTALTLPGLESADADRSKITFQDHVDAIVKAIEAADAPVVLTVHSATGFWRRSRPWSTWTPHRARARSTPTSRPTRSRWSGTRSRPRRISPASRMSRRR